jgi:hypothetical protein
VIKFSIVLCGLMCCSFACADDIASGSSAASINDVIAPATVPAAAPGIGPDQNATISLPNIPEPAVQSNASLLPTQNGVLQLKGNLDGDHFLIRQNFNSTRGVPVDFDYVTQKIPDTTVGWLLTSKPDKTEAIMNLGWRLGGNQQLVVSTAQMRATVDADIDGRTNPNLNQTSGGLNYRYFPDRPWLSGIELSGYSSQGQSLSTASDDSQHIAGSNLVGMHVGLEASPLPDAKLKIGVGSERLSYDSLSGIEPVQNLNTSIKWSQIVTSTVKYSAAIEGNANARNASTGFDFNLRNGQQLGFRVARTQTNDGQPPDNALKLSYTLQFGNKFTPFQSKPDQAPWSSSLVPEVMQRPSYLPKSVLSKPDSSFN